MQSAMLLAPVLAIKHDIGLNKIIGTAHIDLTLAATNEYAAAKRALEPQTSLGRPERGHVWRWEDSA
jgi:hypothetical protein